MWKTSAVLVLMAYSWLPASSQTPPTQVPEFRVDIELALVDVIAEIQEKSLHTRALLTELKKEDLRIFEDGHEVPIRSFDIGAHHETRLIALWLIVQGNTGVPSQWHSGSLRGKTALLRPALDGLYKSDALGVTHWCDDGTASLDLPPGQDSDAALVAVDRLISQHSIEGENRRGELAMQRMIRMILDNVHQSTPQRLPIFLFLYGDSSGTFVDEVNHIIEDVLAISGIIFGMSDNGDHADSEQMFRNG